MTNCEKKLDALIDALGFDVEEVNEQAIPSGQIVIPHNYKITKRNGQLRHASEVFGFTGKLPLDCRVPCVPLPVQSKSWGCIVEYCSDHAEDIEIGINDFGTLRPIWEFMTGDRE
tara:strand:+ start:18897 stop:19241 length:345 start_codon:yes stop_codon:yes gene_type:complete